MSASAFTSMVRPFNWLLLVSSHIKVPPALLLLSASLEEQHRTQLVPHWLHRDNKLVRGQSPWWCNTVSSFVLMNWTIWNSLYHRSEPASAGEQGGHWEASCCWDADSAATTDLVDLFVTFELLRIFASHNLFSSNYMTSLFGPKHPLGDCVDDSIIYLSSNDLQEKLFNA